MTTLTTEETDYLTAYDLWSEHMRIEAADRGYDLAAGRAAQKAYLEASMAHESGHASRWQEDGERVKALYAKRREGGAA